MWIINGAIGYTPNIATFILVSLSTTSVTTNTANQIISLGTGSGSCGVPFTWVITNAITTTYYITAATGGSSSATSSSTNLSWATCTRIA